MSTIELSPLDRLREDIAKLQECRIEGAMWLKGVAPDAAGELRAERSALNRQRLAEFIRANAEKIAGMAALETRHGGEGVEITTLRLAFGPPPRKIPRGVITVVPSDLSP